VLVDGIDIRDLSPDDLWDRIGLVPQKPYLFTGTVASNLRYGKPDATEDEMWEALTVAEAAEFVAAMPGGLDARIAQGGSNVSGGQRQRLAIARALVRKPEVYLFDDSFSALDLATDARLRARLGPWTRDATVLVVAQRVSTIATADQILVLEDGRPVGLGTHAELLESSPTYAEIVSSQIGEGEHGHVAPGTRRVGPTRRSGPLRRRRWRHRPAAPGQWQPQRRAAHGRRHPDREGSRLRQLVAPAAVPAAPGPRPRVVDHRAGDHRRRPDGGGPQDPRSRHRPGDQRAAEPVRHRLR
jgi:energy-coupling factor transporter ATP-binding protein EcfA2